MKKIIFILFATITVRAGFAQLKNTRWDGAIKGDNPRNAILDFKKDTLILYAASGNEVQETMTYITFSNIFTIRKIDGVSDCGTSTPGKYEFEIKGDKMLIKLIDDPCQDRSSALDATNWTKQEDHHSSK